MKCFTLGILWFRVNYGIFMVKILSVLDLTVVLDTTTFYS